MDAAAGRVVDYRKGACMAYEMPMESQAGLIGFLLRPENYPERPRFIIHHESHISHVFVGDSVVYKIKKPVNFGFLDFTSLEKRRFYCREEVALNARLAGDTYLGVVPLYGKGKGYSFKRSKGSVIIEYAVKMTRIPEETLLSHLIGRGKLLYGAVDDVGEILARFHREARVERLGPYGGIESVRMNTEENFDQIAPYRGNVIDERFYSRLVSFTRDFIAENALLLADRKGGGFVREVHGDLRAEHVCLAHPPIILDCIEFNRRFRISDVLEDVAFLFMDLEYRGRFDLSAAVSHAYFSHLPEAASTDLLRFYKTYRAVVRGKVEAFTADALHEDQAARKAALGRAGNYYSLAQYYVAHCSSPFNPLVLMGPAGSGKSVIAADVLPDALVLRSDEIRKRLRNVPAGAHMYADYGKGLYDPAITEATYLEMTREAVSAAKTGRRVVVDATFLTSPLRHGFFETCMGEGLNPFFVSCFADPPILRERVRRRMQEGADVSDAHLAILDRQLRVMEQPQELPSFRVMRLDTGDAAAGTIGQALKLLL
ncbi:MAG: AAA family ATPase [Syntrophorhabdales bacterium]|jgi:aminoglycoside phosphotransferase family enzyme/predicted kinase